MVLRRRLRHGSRACGFRQRLHRRRQIAAFTITAAACCQMLVKANAVNVKVINSAFGLLWSFSMLWSCSTLR